MNRFLAFVKKEFRHIFRDYRTMLMLFAMPIAQILIFGYVISNDIKNAKIGILDHSKDAVTREITQKLVASGYFVPNAILANENEIEPAFKKEQIRMAVVFAPNFAQTLEKDKRANVQLIADASDVNSASLLVNYATGIIQKYQIQTNNNVPGGITISSEVRMLYNEALDGVYMSVPGIMGMVLILVSAMMTSLSITREKEFGSMEVLLISPLNPLQIILGKVAPYVTLAFINALSILALGVFLFGVPILGNLALLLFACFLYILLGLSLGIFFSTIAKNQQVAMFLSLFVLMLPTVLLSGFIFPIANMPWPLRILSGILPPQYFITLIKAIMLKGNGITLVYKEILILCGYIVLFVALSVKKFKIRLE